MNFFSKIYRNGLGEGEDALTELRTCITNLIVIFTVPFVMSYIPIFYKLGLYTIIICYIISSLVLIYAYYLNHLKKNGLATKIVFIAASLLVFLPIITFGRETEVQALLPIMMIFVFVLFDKTYELVAFSTFALLVFISSFYILDVQSAIVQDKVYIYDYYLNMGFAIFSCGFLAFVMMKTLKNYNNQQDEAFRKLAEQNRIIKKQNEEMELFTMMASHDLKTPTRTMLSFLGLLNKTGDIKNPASQEYLEIAMSGARQLNDLITGISDFKNTTVEKAEVSYRSTNKIIDQVIVTMDISKDNSISITATDLHNLKIASTELYHIFQNLIGNAIKYNKSEKKIIKIESTLTSSAIIFTVSDNGIGIENEYLDYIFDPFKKIHASGEYESTGLGLAICKKIVTSYDASIRAESKGPELGTEIIITCPRELLNEEL